MDKQLSLLMKYHHRPFVLLFYYCVGTTNDVGIVTRVDERY